MYWAGKKPGIISHRMQMEPLTSESDYHLSVFHHPQAPRGPQCKAVSGFVGSMWNGWIHMNFNGALNHSDVTLQVRSLMFSGCIFGIKVLPWSDILDIKHSGVINSPLNVCSLCMDICHLSSSLHWHHLFHFPFWLIIIVKVDSTANMNKGVDLPGGLIVSKIVALHNQNTWVTLRIIRVLLTARPFCWRVKLEW